MNNPKEWFRRGYFVVPVDSQDHPVFKGIYDTNFTPKDIDGWASAYPGANLAIACGINDVVGFDVDIDDEYVANCIRRRIVDMIGGNGKVLMRRRQNSPRFAVFCRAGEEMEKIAAAHSKVYLTDAFGDRKQQIEYKAHRCILTVEGFHRRDKDSKYLIKEIPYASDLSVLSYDAFRNVMDSICIYEKDGWTCIADFAERTKRKKGRQGWTSVDSLFEETGIENATIKRRPFTEDEIEDLLAEIDGSLRENWMNVGMCFWNLNKGVRKDFNTWTEWSKQFPGYKDERDQQKAWESFAYYPHMTFEVLERRIKIARKKRENQTPQQREMERFRPKILSDEEEYKRMINRFVLICDGALVADMSKPPSESIRTIPQMREFLRSKKMFVEQRNGRGAIIKKSISMFDHWLQDKDHFEAWGIDYVPGLGPIIPSSHFKGRQQQYYNKYNPPYCVHIGEREKRNEDGLDMFYEHMKYLFPNGGDQWMLNWMAQLIQEPQKRIGRVSPFSISTYEGTGRGWLSELLARLVGFSNYATVKDITDIIRPGAKSGYLDGTVLLVVNEVCVKGKERYNLLSQLKTLLTDDLQEIDVKYGKHTYNQHIYTRVFFQSNYIDGLVIDERDSRIQPFINENLPKDREYYSRLYSHLERDDFVDCVYSELKERPINYTLLQYSQDTVDRQRVIRSTKSPTALAFYEFRQLLKEFPFTDDMLDKFMLDYLQKIGVNGESSMINQKALRFLRMEGERYAQTIGGITIKAFTNIPFESGEAAKKALSNAQSILDEFFRLKGIRRT